MRTFLLLCTILLSLGPFAMGADEAIDWDKAREIRRRERAGQQISAEERAYMEKAIAARRQMQRDAKGGDARPIPTAGKATIGLVPLTDMIEGQIYKGQSGGLYGEGRNAPPKALAERARAAQEKVQPLDAQGRPAADGKVVLLSVGMSNTTQEFAAFQKLAAETLHRRKELVIVDGAQGGQDAADWVNPEQRFRKDNPSVWEHVDRRLKQAGVTPQQVQVVWMKQARRNPAALGEFPAHAQQLKADMAAIIARLKQTFPNLRLVYVSSRTYAGYAGTQLNPEPYAYESAFAVRWLIEEQPGSGEPVILWGPYLWADGTAGRNVDDLKWTREDFAGDGTHPSDGGRRKVAEQLLKFFVNNTRWWADK